jgi:hypothetical protein
MTRFQYDYSLLGVLLDRWRPETHTFHFTVDEMTLILRDTSLLMGLPCAGEPLQAVDISDDSSGRGEGDHFYYPVPGVTGSSLRCDAAVSLKMQLICLMALNILIFTNNFFCSSM